MPELDIYDTVAVINHAFEQHQHNMDEVTKSKDWLIGSLGVLPDSPLKVADGLAWLDLGELQVFITETGIMYDDNPDWTIVTSAKELFNLIHQWACDGHSVALAEAVGQWI